MRRSRTLAVLLFATASCGAPEESMAPAASPATGATDAAIAEAPDTATLEPAIVEAEGTARLASVVVDHEPSLRWQRPLASGGTVLFDANDEIVVAGTEDGRVTALDLRSGAVRWEVDLGAGVTASEFSPSFAMLPTLDAGVVYIAASTGSVHAVDTDSGSVLWSTDIGGLATDYPVVVDGVIVVGLGDSLVHDDRVDFAGGAGTGRGGSIALDAATGAIRWERSTDLSMFVGAGPGDSVILTSFDNQYVGNGAVERVAALSGDVLWRVDGIDGDSPPASGNGVILVAARELMAFEDDGALLWRTSSDWCSCALQFPSVVGDVAVIATNEAGIYGLDLHHGATCWGAVLGDVFITTTGIDNGLVAASIGSVASWLDAGTGSAVGSVFADQMVGTMRSTDAGELVATGSGQLLMFERVESRPDASETSCS